MTAATVSESSRGDSPSPSLASDDSLESLQYFEILEIIATFAATDIGRARVRAVRPSVDLEGQEQRRQLQIEVEQLVAEHGRIVPSLEEPLAALSDRVQRGARLEPSDWSLLLEVLDSINRVDELQESAEDLERLPLELLGLRDEESPGELVTRSVLDRIVSVVDGDGQVRDDASPELSRLRSQLRSERVELQRRFDSFVQTHRETLGEETVTSRDGRLTVLLPSGSRGQIPGLVHGRSGTGRSYYFEPLDLVEGNNTLQGLRGDEAAEVQRIITELEELIGARRPQIAAAFELLALLDLHQAVAGFARTARARLVEWSDQASRRSAGSTDSEDQPGAFLVVGARHPLLEPSLAWAREQALGHSGHTSEIVPLDLDFGDRRVLVVTGPNAGGKTVALKTLGLIAVMSLSGLPVLVDAGTRIPRFSEIVAVVGDDQDVLAEQSTFSARLLRFEEAWKAAREGALILLDEVGTGTSPQEGAALSQALLERLAERGCYAALTTHLIELAAAALRLDRADSLAMELDKEHGRPTFTPRRGAPSSSHAIELARRLDLPAEWIERAEQLVGDELLSLQALMTEAESSRRRAHEQEERLASLVADQELLNARLEEREGELRTRSQKLARQLEAELVSFRSDATRRLDQELQKLAERSTKPTRSTRQKILDGVMSERPTGPQVAPRAESGLGEPGEVAAGDTVQHVSLGWEGRLESVKGDQAEVVVRGKRLRCRVGELRRRVSGASRVGRTSKRQRSAAVSEGAGSREVATELNLIGQRVEPALDTLEAYLDQATLGASSRVRVIHGHGTGRLRTAVRDFLKSHPAVSRHRPADDSEGGNGATIVELR